MTSITNNEIDRIAMLARLKIEDNSKPKFQSDLSNILKLIDKLQVADTSSIDPSAWQTNFTSNLRADLVTDINQRDLLEQNVPKIKQALFLVPKYGE